ncbi:winged helix-turn-helix transcriptional regulator [Microlunatus antarcticus]|uniref:DNA-binding HxlR family transcriptional regulator n=1 Tax=Microlunatus antarcticus TaxID=53388 RepID=A0A7W5P7H3_9ACTN|nr:helix-turn-helix domain-containing protein [Microlunatus antarcticus]MBB3326856.1 DNA-binding HxlR family transcriptional regulator [Microlunatus antarcticus]
MPAAPRNDHCSIARSLEVLGEKWTLLVVREACWGRTRFSDFREALGVAPDVLTDRLATLVDVGVLERRPYRVDGGRQREEYVLTPAGEDLRLVLGALSTWGREHRPDAEARPATFVEAATGESVSLSFVASDGRPLSPAEVTAVRPTPR